LLRTEVDTPLSRFDFTEGTSVLLQQKHLCFTGYGTIIFLISLTARMHPTTIRLACHHSSTKAPFVRTSQRYALYPYPAFKQIWRTCLNNWYGIQGSVHSTFQFQSSSRGCPQLPLLFADHAKYGNKPSHVFPPLPILQFSKRGFLIRRAGGNANGLEAGE